MKDKELFLTYIAVNQIHVELIDRLGGMPIFKQNLKRHLKEANKIMSDHIDVVYEKGEKAYNEISKFADALIESVNIHGHDKVRVFLEALRDGEVQEVD